jgi:hypothetical protein
MNDLHIQYLSNDLDFDRRFAFNIQFLSCVYPGQGPLGVT